MSALRLACKIACSPPGRHTVLHFQRNDPEQVGRTHACKNDATCLFLRYILLRVYAFRVLCRVVAANAVHGVK